MLAGCNPRNPTAFERFAGKEGVNPAASQPVATLIETDWLVLSILATYSLSHLTVGELVKQEYLQSKQ